MRIIKEHAASIKAPPGLDDPVKVLTGVAHYEALVWPATAHPPFGSHYRGGQAALCSGGILANAFGEQSMLAEGMA